MAAYLYNVGKLYLNEQKHILTKIEKENIQQKIILDSFQSNKIKKISEKNVKLISNFSEINIDQLESDSEVETSEDN
tara:strand:+ start:127 stop:357 length:231 start_codon:yes stop_codon:yes gene_type:complete